MIFHKQIENIYKSMLFARCDDTGLLKYFSYQDFPGMEAENYGFQSSKGHKLQGYFYHYADWDPDRLVIFEHGFGGGHRSYMKEIEILCRAGYRVFAYDHTGCMESGGEGAGGLSQSLCDLNDCLNTLKADPSVNTSDISVVGHSWGGFSTLNIAALHPDVKRIVVLSGVVSMEQMAAQNFGGPLKGYRKHIIQVERESNPGFADDNAVETLRGSDVRALLIYSDNDNVVKKRFHYDVLYDALRDKKNIEFLLETEKGHNPNYSAAAVKCMGSFPELMKRGKKLKTDEEKKNFRESIDWNLMTEQDERVWEKILDFLK